MSVDTVHHHVHFVGEATGAGEQAQPAQPTQPAQPAQQPTMTTEPPSYEPHSFLRNEALQNEKNLTYDQVFKVEDPIFHDAWAAVLFVLVVSGFIAVSVIAGIEFPAMKLSTFIYSRRLLPVILVPVAALCLSQAYLMITHYFPKKIICLTGVAHIIVCILVGVLCFAVFQKQGNDSDSFLVVVGIIHLVSAGLFALCLCSWLPRIPYSAIMLQTTTDIARNHGHIFLTSFLGSLLTLFASMWYTLTMVFLLYNRPNGTDIGLACFVSFAFYWIVEVTRNVVHVTVSGVYGSWYFCSQKPCGFPSNATRSAFRRATTYSIGSISLGSLLVTIVRFLEQILRSIGQSTNQQNPIQIIVVCLARLLLLFLEGLINLINEYAFSYIALFGTSYMSSAKATWRLLKDRGVTLLVNECLIDPVLSMGAFLIGSLCFAIVYPLCEEQQTLAGIAAFFGGALIANVFLTPIKSGVTTLFVAMAFEPDVLVHEHPDLYASIVRFYPNVAVAVHA